MTAHLEEEKVKKWKPWVSKMSHFGILHISSSEQAFTEVLEPEDPVFFFPFLTFPRTNSQNKHNFTGSRKTEALWTNFILSDSPKGISEEINTLTVILL
jgi:hypothetical protein